MNTNSNCIFGRYKIERDLEVSEPTILFHIYGEIKPSLKDIIMFWACWFVICSTYGTFLLFLGFCESKMHHIPKPEWIKLNSSSSLDEAIAWVEERRAKEEEIREVYYV